jgi:hypothetical protein
MRRTISPGREVLARRRKVGAEVEQLVLDVASIAWCRSSRTWRRAIPIALLASSTSPIAAMRGSALDTREPPTSPVSPPSPVRV